MHPDHPMQWGVVLATTLAGCASHAAPVAPASMYEPPMLEIARPQARAHAVVSLPRQLAVGAALAGRMPPGSQVSANGAPVPVAADGRIGWPVPPGVAELRVRVQWPDGGVIVQRVKIGPN